MFIPLNCSTAFMVTKRDVWLQIQVLLQTVHKCSESRCMKRNMALFCLHCRLSEQAHGHHKARLQNMLQNNASEGSQKHLADKHPDLYKEFKERQVSECDYQHYIYTLKH
ncbi:hypothetical protein DPX16_16715 [Anabarilius grahami]|uniref:Uncharacterized protein n=1 Tax=Anabarilius grahami TaxID=495550 RepID=A0A3N0YSV6_ANAGA|nr:hypothetical protein DPX16_16715 [Anabarilius grahami]